MKDLRTLLVGRETELTVLRRCIEDATRGRGRIALIVGEAGIGKSRLLAASLLVADDRDVGVFLSQSQELERTRPFGPLAETFACIVDHQDPDRAEIARLLSQPITSPSGDPGLTFRIVDAFGDLLEKEALKAPVAVAIDDLQWADPSTIITFRSMARRARYLPIALFAAFRPAPGNRALEGLVESLLREGASIMDIEPLSDKEVVTLATQELGSAPGPRLLEQIAGAAGNPFYILELLKTLGAEKQIETTAEGAESRADGVPANLRLTILRRLSHLSPDTLGVMRRASVLGSAFSVQDLATATEIPVVRLMRTVEEAVHARVLAAQGDDLSFLHTLIREALYQDMPLAQRKELHSGLAKRLAEAGAPSHRIATHMALGAEPGDSEAIEWLRRAAEEAGRSAIGIAVELCQRAIELAAPGSRDQQEMTSRLVYYFVYSGRLIEAEAKARELIERRPDPDIETELRGGLAISLERMGRLREASEEWARMLRTSGVTEISRARALGEQSRWLALAGQTESAESRAREALAIGNRVGDSCAVSYAEMTLSIVAQTKAEVVVAVDRGRSAVAALAGGSEAPYGGYPLVHLTLGGALVSADHIDEARDAVREGRRLAEERGTVGQLPLHQWSLGFIEYFSGKWDDSVAEAEAGLDLADEFGEPTGALAAHALIARILIHRGEFQAAEERTQIGERLLRDVGTGLGTDWLLWCRALLQEASRDYAGALDALTQVWDANPLRRFLAADRCHGPDLVRLGMRVGNTNRARAVTEFLEEGAHRAEVPTARGAALRCRGLLENDADILLSSVEAYVGGPRPVDLALSREDAARALALAGKTQEPVRLLEEAIDTFEQVGAGGDLARVEALLSRLGVRRGKRPRPERGWDSLTSTELEVVDLVREGLTNPQIGERMYISRRTVQTHLAHVFAKLGLGSRVELAAEAARRAR
jgi:DNA-binding CsgD family transcriptional regulator